MWFRLMNTGYRGLEFRGPGAVAHMSLHLKSTMSKNHQHLNTDSKPFPDLHRGSRLSVKFGDQLSSGKIRCTASVEPI